MGQPYRVHTKTAEMAACSEDFLCGDKSDAALANFFSYDYGASASEAAEKTATDGKIIANAPCAL